MPYFSHREPLIGANTHEDPCNSLPKRVFLCFLTLGYMGGVHTSVPKCTLYPYTQVDTLQELYHKCKCIHIWAFCPGGGGAFDAKWEVFWPFFLFSH